MDCNIKPKHPGQSESFSFPSFIQRWHNGTLETCCLDLNGPLMNSKHVYFVTNPQTILQHLRFWCFDNLRLFTCCCSPRMEEIIQYEIQHVLLLKRGISILSSVIEVIQPPGFTWSPHHDTRVTPSHFIFCGDSQDRGSTVDIKLCLGR